MQPQGLLQNIITPHNRAAGHTGTAVHWWAYLENFHGLLAHSGPTVGRRDMDGGRVLGAVVQKVPGPPLSILPALLTLPMGKHRLLSEPDL